MVNSVNPTKSSIKPSIWGPHGWKFMHYVSLGYPSNPTEEDKKNYKTFYILYNISCLVRNVLIIIHII